MPLFLVIQEHASAKEWLTDVFLIQIDQIRVHTCCWGWALGEWHVLEEWLLTVCVCCTCMSVLRSVLFKYFSENGLNKYKCVCVCVCVCVCRGVMRHQGVRGMYSEVTARGHFISKSSVTTLHPPQLSTHRHTHLQDPRTRGPNDILSAVNSKTLKTHR